MKVLTARLMAFGKKIFPKGFPHGGQRCGPSAHTVHFWSWLSGRDWREPPGSAGGWGQDLRATWVDMIGPELSSGNGGRQI